MRRCLFLPLVVTGISLYLKDPVFITGSFSTELSAAGAAAGADPLLCAEAVAAAKAPKNIPMSRREYFIRSPFAKRNYYTPSGWPVQSNSAGAVQCSDR